MKGCRETDDSSSCSEDDVENQGALRLLHVHVSSKRHNSDPLSSIYFRPLQPSDRDQIKQLHEEWFPVTYKDEFYDDLVVHRMVNSGEELYTCAAVLRDDQTNKNATTTHDNTTHDNTTHDNDESTMSVWQQLNNAHNDKKDEIVACVVGSFVETTRMSTETAALLVADPHHHVRMFYIMTLGTVTDFRHLSLATLLIQRIISLVEQDLYCGTLYLHVITFNIAAIRFYEKLGFYRVTELKDYYRINNVNYNCYIYARAFHGNRMQIDYYYLLSNLVSTIWRKVTMPFTNYRQLTAGGGSSSHDS